MNIQQYRLSKILNNYYYIKLQQGLGLLLPTSIIGRSRFCDGGTRVGLSWRFLQAIWKPIVIGIMTTTNTFLLTNPLIFSSTITI